jgi:hypothetical protein
MFVPVSCTSCGKPFQVPEEALGKLAPCPWCQTVVTALPVSAPLQKPEPAAQPELPPSPQQPAPPPAAPVALELPKAAAPAPQEPLSLDDAEPVPDRVLREQPVRRRSVEPAPPAPKPKRLLVTICVALVLVVFGTAGTVLYRSYGAGRMSDRGWIEFTPPDGSFTVALPGQPAEDPVDANLSGSVTAGKRYSVHGWYSGTTVWVAYNDLAPDLVLKLPADRSRALAAGTLQAARERERERLEGTITTEAEMRLGDWWGVEVHMDTPRGKAVEWLILVGAGAHPRVYIFGAEAKELAPQSPVCRRLRNSFQVNE